MTHKRNTETVDKWSLPYGTAPGIKLIELTGTSPIVIHNLFIISFPLQVEQPVKKYDRGLSWWGNVYVWTHFLMILAANSLVAMKKEVC